MRPLVEQKEEEVEELVVVVVVVILLAPGGFGICYAMAFNEIQ